MKTINYRGKPTILLTHKEKAQEMGISTKTLTRWKKAGKIKEENMIKLPQWRNSFFFQGEDRELVSRNSPFSEKVV